MTKKAKLSLVKEITAELDSDIYKYIFVRPEEPDEAKEQIKRLLEIVDKYIK